jgi:hypothetical protein
VKRWERKIARRLGRTAPQSSKQKKKRRNSALTAAAETRQPTQEGRGEEHEGTLKRRVSWYSSFFFLCASDESAIKTKQNPCLLSLFALKPSRQGTPYWILIRKGSQLEMRSVTKGKQG